MENDIKLISNIDSTIISSILNRFDKINRKRMVEITQIYEDGYNEKICLLQDINDTYDKLKMYYNNFSDDIEVVGKYEDYHEKPSVEYWRECNLGKSLAIDWFLNDLNKEVRTDISEFKYNSDDGMYSGGDVFILTI
jgi:hypothetical protein